MSFADWLTETQRRYATKPPDRATAESIRQFTNGAHSRLTKAADVVLDRRTTTTTLAGVEAAFLARTRMDYRRADSLVDEAPIAEWLFAELGHDDTVWDIGCYHGHYAVLAALHGATVVGFEPDPANRARVLANIELNDCFDRVDLRHVALSDTNGEATFGGPAASEQAIGTGQRRVVTARGEAVFASDPDVVKLDVEGHELAVLSGLGDRLDDVDRIAIEIHHPDDVAAVRDRLESAGLTVRELPCPRSQTYLGGVRR